MTTFSLRLFGSVVLEVPNSSVTYLLTDKERALLAYLILEAARPHRRETLISLLWPDRPERAARQSLRQALYRIRQAIGDQNECILHLLINSESLQFTQNNCWVDVIEFKSNLKAFRAHHVDGGPPCPLCVTRLEKAAGLFQGEFMEGFSLRDTPQFDIWQLLHRDAYHHQMLDTLSILANHYLLQCDFAVVVSFAQWMIKVEPWLEPAHRLLMRMLALQGRRGEALHQYEVCRLILRRELGVDPSMKTSQLYSKVHDDLPIDLEDDENVFNLSV